MQNLVENLGKTLAEKIGRFTKLEKRLFIKWLNERMKFTHAKSVYQFLNQKCCDINTGILVDIATYLGYDFNSFVETAEVLPLQNCEMYVTYLQTTNDKATATN